MDVLKCRPRARGIIKDNSRARKELETKIGSVRLDEGGMKVRLRCGQHIFPQYSCEMRTHAANCQHPCCLATQANNATHPIDECLSISLSRSRISLVDDCILLVKAVGLGVLRRRP